MLFCLKHWRMTSKSLQDGIWATYQPGQERRKNPSPEYLLAQERAICYVALKEGHITQAEADERILHRESNAEFIAEILPLLYGSEKTDG